MYDGTGIGVATTNVGCSCEKEMSAPLLLHVNICGFPKKMPFFTDNHTE